MLISSDINTWLHWTVASLGSSNLILRIETGERSLKASFNLKQFEYLFDVNTLLIRQFNVKSRF